MIPSIIYVYMLGLLSILSPCTFIIIPILLADMTAKLKQIIFFFLGLTTTFGILGILSALTGKLLTNFIGGYLYLFAGFITLITGFHLTNLLQFTIPSVFSNMKTKNNYVLGLLYGGLSLSCVGPLLAVVLVYITTTASTFFGFMLMVVFSLGFITPFLVFGFIITDKSVRQKLTRYTPQIRVIGGTMLIAVSVYLFYTGFRGLL